MLGRGAARVLQQHGAVNIGPGGLSQLRRRACARLAALWRSIAGVQCVVWFDNYVRPRAFVDPGRGFRLYNCTPFAVLHTARLPEFHGLPAVTQLVDLRRRFVLDLEAFHPVFLDMLTWV